MKRNQTLHEMLIPSLVAGLGVRRYLELGCHENETVLGVRHAMGEDAVIVAVDQHEPSYRVKNVAYRIMSTAEYLSRPVYVDAPFDLVFIDADHSAEAVLRDFKGIWPHLSPEGLVLLHDGNPETLDDTAPGFCGDGWRAIRSITDSHEAITLPYHPGLTLVRKRMSRGPQLARSTSLVGAPTPVPGGDPGED